MATFSTVTYTAPAYWASYLINGDASGFNDDREQADADAFVESVGLGSPVDCSEQEFMSHPDFGMAGDCCSYTFLKHGI